jgi:hypothetical protein
MLDLRHDESLLPCSSNVGLYATPEACVSGLLPSTDDSHRIDGCHASALFAGLSGFALVRGDPIRIDDSYGCTQFLHLWTPDIESDDGQGASR